MGVPLSVRLLGREIDPKRSFIGVKRQLTQDVTTKFNILSHLKTHDEIYKYSIEHRNEFWRKVANDSIYFEGSANKKKDQSQLFSTRLLALLQRNLLMTSVTMTSMKELVHCYNLEFPYLGGP